MEITPETETKHEKMFYLSTSSSPSQKSQEKCEEIVSIPISVPGRQNNPQRVFDANTNVSTGSSTETSRSTFICDSKYNSCSSNSNSTASYMTESVVNSIFIPEYEHETIQGKAAHSHTTQGNTCSSILDPCTDIPSCHKKKSTHDEQKHTKTFLSLFDLAWEDILFSNLLPYLHWTDLYNLRATCTKSKEMIEEYFCKLKCVNLSQHDKSFTNEAFQILACCCSKLRTLILPECHFVSDANLILIFKNNCLLSHVDIGGCTRLTGRCLLSLTVHCKNLKTLKLKGCNWISRGAVETIIAQLRQLEEVDFSSCSVLSNQQLIPFAQAFPGLKVLRLAHIQSVNDATLVALSRNCRNMHTLDTRSCSNVTDNGIRSVIEYCPNLKQLFIANCSLVTESTISLLRRRGNVVIDRPDNQLALYLGLIPRMQV